MLESNLYSAIINVINRKFGYCYNNAEYYNNINEWLTWYKGYSKSFHTVKISNGLTCPTRELYKLNMAKRVCEDWSSSLLNEDVRITVSSDNNNKSSVFVQGTKGNGGVLGTNNFNSILPDLIEQTFALGTGAIVINLKDIGVYTNGSVVATKNTSITLDTYNANCIFPMSYKNKIITECSFLSELLHKGKSYYLISTHIKENGSYVIYNTLLDDKFDDVNIKELNILPKIVTKSTRPLFSIIKTNIANNIDLNSPLGISIYSTAIDNVKCCDIAFDSCIREVITGQRIVMMDKSLLTTDDKGRPIAPQDVKQTYMQFFGDDALGGDKNLIKEFHPALNTDALDKELQNQLNMLSEKVGLGTGYYKFDGTTVQTATEYIGNKNDFMRNAKKMTKDINDALKNLILGILFVGKNVLNMSVNDNAKIDIVISDGVIESDTEERSQDRQDVKDGIMSKAEYRAKWYGETIEEAELKLSSLNSIRSNTLIKNT